MKYRALRLTTQILVMAIVVSVALLFVGMAVLVLIHVCIVGRSLRRGISGDNNHNNVMVERGRHGNSSMSMDDLEKLPCFEFKAKEMKGSRTTTPNSSPVDCAVCLENFKAGEKCRLLPLCGHSFHAECVDMWLLRTPICPICRASADLLVSAEGRSRRDDTSVNQFSNYVQMDGEGGHLGTASIEAVVSQAAETGNLTEAGTEAGNGQGPMESNQSGEPCGRDDSSSTELILQQPNREARQRQTA